MLTLVSGGAASGKSEYAESLAVKCPSPRVYIATMQVFDEECRQRIARHGEMRAGKGFFTVECPLHLSEVQIPKNCTVLLECLSNLAANECFDGDGFDGAVERILTGVDRLTDLAAQVIIVTNELFSDGCAYDGDMLRYLEALAALNCAIAARADNVAEVVCGIPLQWKEASV